VILPERLPYTSFVQATLQEGEWTTIPTLCGAQRQADRIGATAAARRAERAARAILMLKTNHHTRACRRIGWILEAEKSVATVRIRYERIAVAATSRSAAVRRCTGAFQIAGRNALAGGRIAKAGEALGILMAARSERLLLRGNCPHFSQNCRSSATSKSLHYTTPPSADCERTSQSVESMIVHVWTSSKAARRSDRNSARFIVSEVVSS
jgi:hypothetical protein